jgi:hypothetical protein
MVSNAFNLANVAVNTANSNVAVTGFTANVAVGQYLNAANVQVSNAVLFNDGSSLTGGASSMSIFDYTGDGVTTNFSTGNYSATSVNNTWVYIGGVYQRKNQYSWTGTTIAFNQAPPNGANIEVQLTTYSVPISTPAPGSVYPVSLSQGGPSWTTSGNFSVTGNVYSASTTASYFAANVRVSNLISAGTVYYTGGALTTNQRAMNYYWGQIF